MEWSRGISKQKNWQISSFRDGSTSLTMTTMGIKEFIVSHFHMHVCHKIKMQSRVCIRKNFCCQKFMLLTIHFDFVALCKQEEQRNKIFCSSYFLFV